jgi:hypothetical protein
VFIFSSLFSSLFFVVREVGTMANWIGRQYHLLQNSNCDVHTPFQRHTHFRRSASAAAAASSASNGAGDPNSPTAATAWTPRVVSIDASVGLDGVVATYGAQESGGSAQDRALQQYKRQQQQQQGGDSSSSSSSTPSSSSRPSHWRDLGGPSLLPYHSKSLYSVPGLYEGTSDFHLFEQGSDVFAREAVVEEVLDRARWFLEECDRPDGIHVLVEANSGWAGAGASLLAHLRDDYGTSMPIFCVSAFTPPPPSSALQGGTFASATPLAQAMLNQALLLSAAAQNATAVLPLSTHYWPTAATSSGATAATGADASAAAAASSPLADIVPASVLRALHAGEYFESGSLLALQLHWATACYRLYPRTDNMATTLQALTQGTSANILSARWIGGQALQDFLDPDAGGADGSSDSERNGGQQQQQYRRGGGGGERESSLSEAMLRRAQPVHTAPKAVPLSLVGHGHAYAGPKPRALNNVASSSSSSGYGAGAPSCDRNNGLLESVHVFGNTETLSHAQVRARMADFGTATGGSSSSSSSSSSASSSSAQAQGQPPAMWRSVSGSTRLNHPPSFPLSFGDLLTEGSVVSVYRCGGAGVELRRLGTWLTSINRGTTITGSYNAARDEDEEDEDDGTHHARQQGDGDDGGDRPNDPTPRLLLSAAHRARRARQAALSLRNAQTDRDRPDDLHLSLTNQQVEELSEAGVTLQNLAESYY